MKGFTLLETIVSLVLLITVVLAQSYCRVRWWPRKPPSASCRPTAWPIRPWRRPDRTLGGTVFHCQLRVFVPTGVNPQFVRGIRAQVWWDFSGRRRDLVRQTLVSNVKG